MLTLFVLFIDSMEEEEGQQAGRQAPSQPARQCKTIAFLSTDNDSRQRSARVYTENLRE